MKPNQKLAKDKIDQQLLDTWKTPPPELQSTLFQIPARYAPDPAPKFDRLTVLLNILLGVWMLGTVYLFKGLWIPILIRTLETVAPSPSVWSAWFSQPITSLATLVGFGFLIWWLNLDVNKHTLPRLNK